MVWKPEEVCPELMVRNVFFCLPLFTAFNIRQSLSQQPKGMGEKLKIKTLNRLLARCELIRKSFVGVAPRRGENGMDHIYPPLFEAQT